MRERVENKLPIHPSWWIDAAAKLNTLIGDETDKLYNLESEVAEKRSILVMGGGTASSAKIMIEALPEYRDMQKQKARIKQIEEFIRIAKIRARLEDSEYKN